MLLFVSVSLLSEKPACNFPSMRDDEMKHIFKDEYDDWRKKHHVTKNVAQRLNYTLHIEGPELISSYEISGDKMEAVYQALMHPTQNGKAWYRVHLKAEYDADRGIPEQTIALNALSIDDLENIARSVPDLKKDIASAREEIEKECLIK